MLRRVTLVLFFGVGGFCSAGGVFSSSRNSAHTSFSEDAQRAWERISEDARTSKSFEYISIRSNNEQETYTEWNFLLVKISHDINGSSPILIKNPINTLATNLLSTTESNSESSTESFKSIADELAQLSKSQNTFDVSLIQNTRNILEALLYVVLSKMYDAPRSQHEASSIQTQLNTAFCSAYENLNFLEQQAAANASRRSSALDNVLTRESAGVATVLLATFFGGYKFATYKPPMVTINGKQYRLVKPRILRNRNATNLSVPTEITRERDKILRTKIIPWSGREIYAIHALERYAEICSAVCYNQPIMYYSADMQSMQSYTTWQNVLQAILLHLNILEATTLIIPIRALRNLIQSLNSTSNFLYKDMIVDMYEFTPRLRQYYRRAAREFGKLLQFTPQQQKECKVDNLWYAKRVPIKDATSAAMPLCEALHGAQRGPLYSPHCADLVQGFQISQNILEALFHVVVMRTHAATGKFYEYFPTFLEEFYNRTMHFVYRNSLLEHKTIS